jgi:hypothetical protein
MNEPVRSEYISTRFSEQLLSSNAPRLADRTSLPGAWRSPARSEFARPVKYDLY